MNILTSDQLYILNQGLSLSPFSTFNKVSAATNGITVNPVDPSAGANTTYRIIVDANTVPVNSTLYITLPPGIALTNLSAINAITGGNVSISSYVDSNGNTVVVIKAFPGPDGADPISGKVIIDVSTITNPASGKISPI